MTSIPYETEQLNRSSGTKIPSAQGRTSILGQNEDQSADRNLAIDTSNTTSSMRTILMDKLQINIVSIVIGALLISVFIAFVDTTRAWCAAILDKHDNPQRYRTAKRKTLSSLVVALISIFIIALIISYFQCGEN